jgi:hypothetical protein
VEDFVAYFVSTTRIETFEDAKNSFALLALISAIQNMKDMGKAVPGKFEGIEPRKHTFGDMDK